MTTQPGEPGEIEALLPWHAAGTLSRGEAARVDAALAGDPELARRYELVREELAETVRLNQSLGAPSPKPLDRLMGRIAAEPKAGFARLGRFSPGQWWQGLLLQLSPNVLAWSAAAAALVILVEAGLLAALFVRGPNPSYRTASVEEPVSQGSYLLVSFVPQASAADITKFLEANKATIIDGPRAGGLYRIKVGEGGLSREELARAAERMQREIGIVRLVAPAQ